MSTLRCTRCGRQQDIEQFRPVPTKVNGRDSWCRACQRQSTRDSRARHGHRYNEQRRRRPVTAACQACGSTYLRSRTDQRFCSRRCKEIAKRAREREARGYGVAFSLRDPYASLIHDADLGAYYSAVRRDPCSYCGGTGGEVDHIVARSNGGPNEWQNYAAICRACNMAKWTYTLLGALLRARLKPLIEQYERVP